LGSGGEGLATRAAMTSATRRLAGREAGLQAGLVWASDRFIVSSTTQNYNNANLCNTLT